MGWAQRIQTLVNAVYPTCCLSCATPVESHAGLCGKCWLAAPFISGLVCETCGKPLMGVSEDAEHCDDCLSDPPPWSAGRAVFQYENRAKKMVWDLKYADRSEIATAGGRWMLTAIRPVLPENPLLAPVPLHWTRLLKRKYNQSELLCRALAKESHFETAPNLLRRVKRTPPLAGLDKEDRRAWLQHAITIQPKCKVPIENRNILLVDDVMTTGATMSAAADACLTAGAASVTAVFLARAGKNV